MLLAWLQGLFMLLAWLQKNSRQMLSPTAHVDMIVVVIGMLAAQVWAGTLTNGACNVTVNELSMAAG